MRKFKIEGIKFEIVNICDMHYKYRVDMLSENMWVTIGKCNTLASGKELAYNYIERQREDEEYNKQAQENYKNAENRFNEELKLLKEEVYEFILEIASEGKS